MPFSISSTSTVQLYDKTLAGLGLTGTVDSGVPPTTAATFAPGCTITDLATGTIYTNEGTAAAPAWVGAGAYSVNLAAADIIAMYATPVLVVPALAGKAIVVDSVDFKMTRTSTAFTGGGVVNVQYAATANGAGTKSHADIAASVVTGAAGTTTTARIPLVLSDIATASIDGIGLYISNQTAAFAAGTGTAVVTIKYHLV